MWLCHMFLLHFPWLTSGSMHHPPEFWANYSDQTPTPNDGLVRKSFQNAPQKTIQVWDSLRKKLPSFHHPSITSTPTPLPRTMSRLWHVFVAVRNEGKKRCDKWPRNGFGVWLVPLRGNTSRQGWQVPQARWSMYGLFTYFRCKMATFNTPIMKHLGN